MTIVEGNRGGPPMRPEARAPKAAELVAARIRRQIVHGKLRDGDSLPPEAVLLKAFGISRPTLREAIRVLEAEGLITVRRGSRGGAIVNIPRGDIAARYAGLLLEYRGTTTADVFAAATMIEAPAAGRLAAAHTADDLRRLRDALRTEQEAAHDPERLLVAQNGFHDLLMELAGNRTLHILEDMLRHVIDTATFQQMHRQGGTVGAAAHAGSRVHHKLVLLIEKGDSIRAEALWHKHITETGAHLLAHGTATAVLDLLG